MTELHSTVEIPGHSEPSFSTKIIWKTFWILLVITVVELGLAIFYYEFPTVVPKHFLNGVFLIGTLAKAFFIIAEFMHLRHEIRNLILSLAIPACLFIWFVIAFLWDGSSYRNLRNDYDRHHVEQSHTKVQPAKKPGEPD
ncbi:MAG TPA: cytochrome C oxidase subunit IV family protein [Puia sp.]|nr:cytochrome C oxidase subunit IV family protein [Puia sp.]